MLKGYADSAFLCFLHDDQACLDETRFYVATEYDHVNETLILSDTQSMLEDALKNHLRPRHSPFSIGRLDEAIPDTGKQIVLTTHNGSDLPDAKLIVCPVPGLPRCTKDSLLSGTFLQELMQCLPGTTKVPLISVDYLYAQLYRLPEPSLSMPFCVLAKQSTARR